jgi:hypothetical protein
VARLVAERKILRDAIPKDGQGPKFDRTALRLRFHLV